MYTRHLLSRLKRALKHFPVLFLNGPRQAGKSTVADWISKEVPGSEYFTLDDLNVLQAATSDPIGFVDAPKELVILDEIQRAPGLFLPIKASVDSDRRAGRFLLTGSANVLLLPHLADSLAGRMQIATLYPLSADELSGNPSGLIDLLFDPSSHHKLLASGGKIDRGQLVQNLVKGGYPEVQGLKADLRYTWFKGYLTTLLQRDVRELARIEGISLLPNLLALLASRSASLLNTEELARTSGLPATTLRRYLTLLQTFFLVQLIPPWASNRGKRLVKSPKIHLIDTGLLCHLLGVDEVGLTSDPNQLGRVLETYVMGELLKMAGWSDRDPALYHYRTTSGAEVDIVLEDRSRQVVGIEVKASLSISKGDLRGLKALAADVGDPFVCGVLFYLGDRPLRLGDRLYALPLPFGNHP